MASLLFPAPVPLDHHYYNDKLQFCEGKFSSSFQRVIVTIVCFFELWSSRHWMTILQKSLQYSVSCPVFLFSLSPTLSSLTLALLFTQWWNTNTLIRRRTLIPLPSSPSPRSPAPSCTHPPHSHLHASVYLFFPLILNREAPLLNDSFLKMKREAVKYTDRQVIAPHWKHHSFISFFPPLNFMYMCGQKYKFN